MYATRFCNDVFPAAQTLHGIDLSTYDPYQPLNPGVSNPPVFMFTCHLNQTQSCNTHTYDVPDAIQAIKRVPGNTLAQTSHCIDLLSSPDPLPSCPSFPTNIACVNDIF